MEPDGLVPNGTFVEFSWHSFESDGDLDGFPYPQESSGYFGASGDGTISGSDANSRPGTEPEEE